MLALSVALPGGCAGSREGGFDSPVPGARIDAIEATALSYRATRRLPDIDTRQNLVECLRADDPLVRFLSIKTLEEMAGESKGFRYDDPAALRALSLPAWIAWAESPTACPEPSAMTSDPQTTSVPHSTDVKEPARE